MSITSPHSARSRSRNVAISCGELPMGSAPWACKFLPHLFCLEHADHSFADLVDDLIRRIGRRHQPKPSERGEAGQGRLRHGRHIRQMGRAHRRADSENPQCAGLVLRQGRRQVVEHEENVAAQQVVHGGRRAAVGHMIELHAGPRLEQGRRQVRCGANALRPVGDGAGVGLGLLDQLLHRRHAELRADDQHVGGAADDRDRLELGRIVVELLVERLVDRQCRRRRGQQRVAIGGCARERFGAHIAGRPGPVLDHHRLLPGVA